MKVQMKKLRKVFCLLAAAAVPALTDMHEAMAQLPQGMSVEEEEENTEATVTKDTTGLDMVTLEIDSLSDGFLDSLDLNRDIPINDYTMIGFQYGMGISQVSWNPSMRQKFRFVPVNFGFLYTRYGKMFGYMPYFGIQAGIFYGQEGYQFEEDDEGYTPTVEGATGALMQVVEVPVMAHCHFDFWKMKLMVNLGLYGGYRLSIQRFGEGVPDEIRSSFLDTDLRLDYGIKGGAGFAFIFDPVEVHFTAMYKHSFGSLYKPDYYSQYYYRYAYPANFIFSVGVHFQLTKRVGKTKHALRQEAREHLGLIRTIQSNVPAESGTSETGIQ